MGSDDDNILDSDSANPFEINARLYRDHHSGLQASRNSAGDPRRFVDLQAQPMPRRMYKISI